MTKLTGKVYKDILDHLGESVIVRNAKDEIVYVNKNLCALLWYSNEEALWMDWYDFWEDKKLVKEKSNESDDSKFYALLKAKDKSFIPVNVSSTKNNNDLFTWIITDITPIKNLVKEINNMSLIVDNIFEILQIEAWDLVIHEEKISVLSLHDIFQKTIEEQHELITIKNINVSMEIEEGIEQSKVLADRHKLEEILKSYIVNWIKFSKRYWYVIFKISQHKWKILFEVIDNWYWVTPQIKRQMFSKATHLENIKKWSYKWAWLGIYISKLIIDEFWSNLKIDTKVWVGTIFHFELEGIR